MLKFPINRAKRHFGIRDRFHLLLLLPEEILLSPGIKSAFPASNSLNH